MPEQTNEELALMIQNGKEELYGELWERVEKFIRYMAGRYWRKACAGGAPSFELDDLIQSGYFALVNAVRYFSQERGFSLITYLSRTLMTEFAEVAGLRRRKTDALYHSASMENPVAEEDDGLTFADMIADPDAENSILAVDEISYRQYTKLVVKLAISELEPMERAFLYARYFRNLSIQKTADVCGISLSTAKSYDVLLPGKLRAGRYAIKLHHCFEALGLSHPAPTPLTIAYSGGVGKFKITATSTTEAAAFALNWQEDFHE